MAATKPKRKTKTKNIQTPGRGLAQLLAKVEASTMRSDLPAFKPGDTVRVHTRIKEGEKERIQIYEGLVIARSNAGANRSFNVRKISHGVGVERIFQDASPKVATVEVVQPGKVRRAKLYYIRELEGRAAKIEREVQTQVQIQAKADSAAKK